MAGIKGRTMLLKKGNGASPQVFTTVAGIKTKSIAGSNGTVDITNDDDGGIRKLLAGLFGASFSISASGVTQDLAAQAALRTDFWAGTHRDWQMVIPGSLGNDTFEGSFAITSYEETGETDGAIMFSIKLESSDALIIT